MESWTLCECFENTEYYESLEKALSSIFVLVGNKHICMYVYFIGKSVNILYRTTQNYILYNITQDETHPAHMGLLACCGEPLS